MWDFIKKVLSDNGEPSSKRVIAFRFAGVICFINCVAVCWLLYKAEYKLGVGLVEFSTIALLSVVLLILGIATFPQLLDGLKTFKGGGTTTTTHMEVEQVKVEPVKPSTP